jgi:hypothetical protein
MMFRFSLLLSILCPLCLSGSAPASPRDELLRLVPDDAGFCVVVRDLRDQLGRLARSPFAAQVAASPFGQSFVQSPELKKLAEFDRQLQAALNLSWVQLRDDVLGDAVVLAYTPGPPGKPEQERGLLLVHARRPDLLAGLFDRLNEVQKKSGEVSAVEPRSHEGQTYYRRQKAKDGDEYYYVRGPLLLLSDKEDALKRALERDRRAPPAAAEAPALARRLDGLGVGRSLAVWWVNPKAFAPALRQKLGATSGGEAAFLATFARYWDALDGVAVSLSVEQEFTAGITAAVRKEALPAAARRLLAEPARPSAVWASFPSNALFTAAGRLSLPPLAEVGGEFLTPECRGEFRDALVKAIGAVLGRDVLPELLRRIGPDWGVCLAPPAPGDKTWLPSLTAVLRLRADGAVPVEQRVLDGLDFAARFVAVAYNTHRPDHMRLRTVQQDGVEVRFLAADQGLPPGLQPAFAWKEGFLVLASSPEAVRRFHAPKTEPPPAAEVPLVRVALQGWAGYLRAYREPVAAFLADAHGQSLGEVHAKLDGLMASLEPFDVVELTQRTGPGRATLTLRLRTTARLQPE